MLEASDSDASCPLLVAAIEAHPGNERPAPGSTTSLDSTRLLDVAHDIIFTEWEETIVAAQTAEDAGKAEVQRLAFLTIAAVEGSVALCRAAWSSAPLKQVREGVLALFAATTTRTESR